MSDAIIVGLITGGITVIVNIILFVSSYIKTREHQAAREARTDVRLDTLTEKIDKIENYIYGGSSNEGIRVHAFGGSKTEQSCK